MDKRVLDVKQSPLNQQRWHLSMECGHDQWVTSKNKPTRKKQFCGTCTKAAIDSRRADK